MCHAPTGKRCSEHATLSAQARDRQPLDNAARVQIILGNGRCQSRSQSPARRRKKVLLGSLLRKPRRRRSRAKPHNATKAGQRPRCRYRRHRSGDAVPSLAAGAGHARQGRRSPRSGPLPACRSQQPRRRCKPLRRQVQTGPSRQAQTAALTDILPSMPTEGQHRQCTRALDARRRKARRSTPQQE